MALPLDAPRIIIVMGVSGAGKTTLGRLLATTYGWAFYDADDFHPSANIAKMQSGQPLDDSDRAAWLEILHQLIVNLQNRHASAVLACSALKTAYRQQLSLNASIYWIYLKADAALLQVRMAQRTDHFMPPSLLASQLATLEEPTDALILDAAETPAVLVEKVIAKNAEARTK